MASIVFTGFNGHTQATVLGANWPNTTLLDDSGVDFVDVGVRERNLLQGITIRGTKIGAVVIDLVIDGNYQYLHVNILNNSCIIGKKAAKSAGKENKGTIYCRMKTFSAGGEVGGAAPPPFCNVVVEQCDSEMFGGKIEKRSSCDHMRKNEILQDVGRVLGVFFTDFW